MHTCRCTSLSRYLCGDAHAARNVHAENHHRVFHVLVVVIGLGQQVEVVAAHAPTLAGERSHAAAGHGLPTATEFTCPQLEEGETGQSLRMDGVVLEKKLNTYREKKKKD